MATQLIITTNNMKQPKERKPDVTIRKLKAKGYRYKLDELTKEEKKQQREGIKEKDPRTGETVTYEAPDYNYYYKEIEGATVKIFKAGDRLYYKNGWFRYMSALPLIEADAIEEKKYSHLQELVQDTKPISVHSNMHVMYVEDTEMIKCQGGPLDGNEYQWRVKYPIFMCQFTDESDGKVKSARYKRNMRIVEQDGRKVRINERDNIYIFDTIIG